MIPSTIEEATRISGSALYERFVHLFDPERRFGADDAFLRLLVAYTEPHRAYHTIVHIGRCLETATELPFTRSPGFELTSTGFEAQAQEDAELALWWHDARYVPMATDNEERSADMFTESAHRLELDEVRHSRVLRAILATKHAEGGPSPLEKYVVDVDMAILGAEPAEYDAYAVQIRQEYAAVPERDYRAGRAALLRRFLARPHLYQREDFRARFEHASRANMHREIASLEKPR